MRTEQILWSIAAGSRGMTDLNNRLEAIALLRQLADAIETKPGDVLGLVISFGVRTDNDGVPGVAADTLAAGCHASLAAAFSALSKTCNAALAEFALETHNECNH